MKPKRYCDGVRRRDFLKVGVLSGLGLTLPEYLRRLAAGEVRPTRGQSAIVIHLSGGPSHIDSFDLKPDAPAEFRGEFKPIQSNVPGLQICEHLPRLARCADKFALVRNITHNLADHGFATKYVFSGSRPLPALDFPGYGAVVSKEKPGPDDLPTFVAIPGTAQQPHFLGAAHGPFSLTSAPQFGRPFNVRGITLANGLTIEDLGRRRQLVRDLDTTFADYQNNDLVSGLDRFAQRAFDILQSRRTRDAFDLSRVPPESARPFGEHGLGQSCLLASRLIEAGVRFVTLSFGNYDTHANNFPTMRVLLRELDEALSSLLSVLSARGLLVSTTVLVKGEFGRTPRVNGNGGRDHWPRAMFALLAGGGVQGGQVLGATTAKAEEPAGHAYSPDDLAATFYHTLGIDYRKEYQTTSGRPVMIVRDGRVIRELFA